MMNGQAVRERAEQDPAAQQRAADARKWRREVADELDLAERYGNVPLEVLDKWERNINEDIAHKQNELWRDLIERSRLRAYRRKLANMPEPQL